MGFNVHFWPIFCLVSRLTKQSTKDTEPQNRHFSAKSKKLSQITSGEKSQQCMFCSKFLGHMQTFTQI